MMICIYLSVNVFIALLPFPLRSNPLCRRCPCRRQALAWTSSALSSSWSRGPLALRESAARSLFSPLHHSHSRPHVLLLLFLSLSFSFVLQVFVLLFSLHVILRFEYFSGVIFFLQLGLHVCGECSTASFTRSCFCPMHEKWLVLDTMCILVSVPALCIVYMVRTCAQMGYAFQGRSAFNRVGDEAEDEAEADDEDEGSEGSSDEGSGSADESSAVDQEGRGPGRDQDGSNIDTAQFVTPQLSQTSLRRRVLPGGLLPAE